MEGNLCGPKARRGTSALKSCDKMWNHNLRRQWTNGVLNELIHAETAAIAYSVK